MEKLNLNLIQIHYSILFGKYFPNKLFSLVCQGVQTYDKENISRIKYFQADKQVTLVGKKNLKTKKC